MEIETLKKQKAVAKRNFSRTANQLQSDKPLAEIEIKLAKLDKEFENFNALQDSIELLEFDAASDGVFEQERTEIEQKYYEIKSTWTGKITESTKLNLESRVRDTTQTKTRLPALDLPEFTGTFSEWLPFSEMFKSIIHNNANLSSVDKFLYLKSALKGDSKKTIESLTISNANYDVAWQLLDSRFNNERLIVQEIVFKLVKFENLHKQSSVNIRKLYDTSVSSIETLKIMGIPVNSWDAILVPILSEKLDSTSEKEWLSSLGKTIPSINSFLSYLKNRCEILEALNSSKLGNHQFKVENSKFKTPHMSKAALVASTSKGSCYYCSSNNHKIYHCDTFLKLDLSKRLDKIKELKLCFNCLSSGHRFPNCQAGKCTKCQLKHNTLLCSTTRKSLTENNQDTPLNTVTNICHKSNYDQVLLSTAKIIAKDNQGRLHTVRVLLDPGSQSNFITYELCKKLNLPVDHKPISISGINQSRSKANKQCALSFSSHQDNSREFTINCIVLNKITKHLPTSFIDTKALKIPSYIKLADDQFNVPGKIDVLLGAHIFWDILEADKIKIYNSQLTCQKTALGWILGGSINNNEIKNSFCFNVTIEEEMRLDKQLEQFWSVEGFASEELHSKDSSEEQFKISCTRDREGRYMVGLPFRDPKPGLGDSFQLALKRFLLLEKRFRHDQEYYNNYSEFINEYAMLGHMELVANHTHEGSNVYYLPHHAIRRDVSSSTKFRVVFDGSAKSTNEFSLNDNLLIGKTLQQDLFSILTRFRTHRFTLIADIAKMYRQILIQDSDRDYQRILWRDSPASPIQIYCLTTVTYGTACAPFLAQRTLKQLADDEAGADTTVHSIILNDFYMDDLITGCNTQEEIIQLRQKLSSIFKRGGFDLVKWASNCPDIFNCDGSDHIQFDQITARTLGLSYNVSLDMLSFPIASDILHLKLLSKRQILSLISKLFDPLGLIGPITVTAKIIMQKLWRLKIDWDISVPDEILQQCHSWQQDLKLLPNLQIPRYVCLYPFKSFELHGFCDASMQAYGACIYLKCVDHNNVSKVTLMCSKSRIAPLKPISIPRLELMGAVLLTNLVTKVKTILDLPISRVGLWSDSTIVLAWLKLRPSSLKLFVANRVAQIQELTEVSDWHHVNSNENPADIISRGSSCSHLIKSALWWNGPHWLSKTDMRLVTDNPGVEILDQATLELKSETLGHSCIKNELPQFFERFSNFQKLIRVVSFCIRFAQNCKGEKIRRDRLVTEELEASKTIILKIVQQTYFKREIDQLRKNKSLELNSSLITLRPFLDENGLIRVGGRLSNSGYAFNKKHPILLPKNNHITNLIIRHFHLNWLHSGPQLTLATIRQTYWILSGRSEVRKVLHKCITCFRANPSVRNQLMGDLPNFRVSPARPFSNTGVDYAGPFNLKERNSRGKTTFKVYVCLFICLSTKAVHLELTFDYTSEEFLNSLKRFMARRGIIKNLYSDNASNFVGAKNQLGKLLKSINFNNIVESLNNQEIKWHFIPPYTPNFGGIWEAAIRSMKYHLKRVVGETVLTVAEMLTLLASVEACLNSRPITPLSNDPTDMESLTPGHFLTGSPLTAMPEEDLTMLPSNRLSRWKLIEQFHQSIWKRWSREYLTQLHPRNKRGVVPRQYCINDLVVLQDTNLPPRSWKLGRIIETHPGLDQVVRVVTIQTAAGVVKRGVNKICLLPMETSSS